MPAIKLDLQNSGIMVRASKSYPYAELSFVKQ